jgi:hypothetical protein
MGSRPVAPAIARNAGRLWGNPHTGWHGHDGPAQPNLQPDGDLDSPADRAGCAPAEWDADLYSLDHADGHAATHRHGNAHRHPIAYT